MADARVDVLLATYNGESYLEALLESVLAQQEVDFHVFVRDDGSLDGTPDIIARYVTAYPDRITALPAAQRLGPRDSFAALMKASAAPYLAFCDQDDVWHPQKLLLLMQAMRVHEEKTGSAVPCLVHSDLQVVGKSLEPIASSFWRHAHIDPRRNRFRDLLLMNTVTGCAALCNRALAERALPIPPEAVMHDHWLALVAAAFGVISVVDVPLLMYRQHGQNTVGAKASRAAKLKDSLRHGFPPNDWSALKRQPAAFAQCYGETLSASDRDTLDALLRAASAVPWRRRLILIRHRLAPGGFLRKLLFWFLG